MYTIFILVFLALATNCIGKATKHQMPDVEAGPGIRDSASSCSLCLQLTDGATSGSAGCASLAVSSPQVALSGDGPIVKVSQGSLGGKKVTSDKTGGEYYSFQGIPYAQPPVGDLRFKAPEEARPWTGVRDATAEGSICAQLFSKALVGSEDCLFLNVYTPQLPSASKSTLLPVMVWIHGGGFTVGSGNSAIYGPDFLVNKGVVLVTLNYRLGVLGFLGLNHLLVSQNNGLKDQRAALRWVQANIAQFGGDKHQVTIFGQSAGSASVELQVLSPSTKGLFQKAISESGNALDRWSYAEPSSAKQRAFLLGKLLGSTTDNEDTLVEFLKAATVEDVITYQSNVFTQQDFILKSANMPFQPTKEEGDVGSKDIFLPDSPLNIMRSGNYQQVPYITGFNSAEAKLFLTAFLDNSLLWAVLPSFMEQFVPLELNLSSGSSQSLALAAEIKKMYFGDETPTAKDIQGLVNLVSDAFIVEGVRRSVQHRLKTSSAPLYVYQFSFVGNLSVSQFCNYGYSFRGAGHSDELGYMFRIRGFGADVNSTDTFPTLWTNFAKTGNPTEGLNLLWEPLTTASQKYLNLDAELRVRNLTSLHTERFALWDRIYASIDN